MTNEELVALALTGDQVAYTELYSITLKLARGIAYSKLRYHPDVDELPHDMVAHILMRLDKFRGESKYSTWATRICINIGLMVHRSSKNRLANEVSMETPLSDQGSRTIEDTLLSSRDEYAALDAKLDIAKLLPQMKPKFRNALVEHFILGKQFNEMSGKDGTIKNQTYRAKCKAREIMDGIAVGEPFEAQNKTSNKTYNKVCKCPCKATFVATHAAQGYIVGHKPGYTQSVKKDIRTPKPLELDKIIKEGMEHETIVNLKIPASAVDKLLLFMPLASKKTALENYLQTI